jgi:cell filamentation protein
MSGDPYLYPGTQTLRNNYGIRDADELDRAERLISRAAMRAPLLPPAEMTPEGLQRIHRHIFGRIYPWGGEFRTINLQKIVTDDKTVAFERGHLVKPAIARFFGELREDNYLRGLDASTFAYRAAAVYVEDLNFIHPFREGNGRASRAFLEQLARQAGHELDQSRIDSDGWMQGAVQSYRQPVDGTHELMTATIAAALTGPSDHGREDGAPDLQPPSAKYEAIARAIAKLRDEERNKSDPEITHDPEGRGR